MYETYWQLKEKPFENTTDPKYFFTSLEHEEALSRLTYVCQEGKPLALLTGDYGSGKTIIGQMLMQSLDPNKFKVIHILNPLLSMTDILKEILRPSFLGEGGIPDNKGDLLHLLREIFIRNFNIGKQNVLIVDEAHLVEDIRFFEELRLLLNYEYQGKFLLILIFLGQTELREKISRLPQLQQRISLAYHLNSLQANEVQPYIEHRLFIAGYQDKKPLFVDCADKIYLHSLGVPRIINHICDLALLFGFEKGIKQIDYSIIREVIKEIPPVVGTKGVI